MNRPLPGKRKANDRKRGGGKRQKVGLFHTLSKPVREEIVKIAIEDAPATREFNHVCLKKQMEEKLRKENIKRMKGMEKASNELLKVIMYYNMWFTDLCVKKATGRGGVDERLASLLTVGDMRDFLKDNIHS